MKTTTSTLQKIPAARISLIGALLIVLAVATTISGLVIAGGAYEPAPIGISDPGPVVVWGSLILRILTDIAAVITIGFLLAAAFLDPSGKNGILSPAGRRDVLRASIAAVIWMLFALTQTIFLLANVLGISLIEALNPQVIATYANDVPATRALIAMAIVALVVALGGYVTSTTGVSAAWLALAVLAATLPALAGTLSSI
jgi:putative copper resistance protein D